MQCPKCQSFGTIVIMGKCCAVARLNAATEAGSSDDKFASTASDALRRAQAARDLAFPKHSQNSRRNKAGNVAATHRGIAASITKGD